MARRLVGILLLSVAAGTGCVESGFFLIQKKEQTSAVTGAVKQPDRSRLPLTPEQVNETNVYQKLEDLNEELDCQERE